MLECLVVNMRMGFNFFPEGMPNHPHTFECGVGGGMREQGAVIPEAVTLLGQGGSEAKALCSGRAEVNGGRFNLTNYLKIVDNRPSM